MCFHFLALAKVYTNQYIMYVYNCHVLVNFKCKTRWVQLGTDILAGSGIVPR